MKIKVQCDCGTRFEFEVEPVNERMPVAIACPGCNADATPLANAVIREQLAANSAPPQTPVRQVTVRQATPASPPAAAAPPAPAPQSGLRISKPADHAAPAAAPQASAAAPAAASLASSAEGAPKFCPKHKTEPAYETCVVCQKPICPKCMEQFGYVCSVYCKSQATSKRIYVPVYAHQKSVVEERSRSYGKLIGVGVFLLLLGLAGMWYWYTYYGRNPKVVYSVLLPKTDSGLKASLRPDDFYELIGPNELLSIKNQQLALLDVTEAKQLWTVPLQGADELAAAKAARAKLEEARQKARSPRKTAADESDFTEFDFDEAFAYANPHVIATTNDIWVSGNGRLARFDRKTGSRKEVPLKEKIRDVTFGSDAILAVCGNSEDRESLTRITLSDGGIQTEEIGAAAKATPAPPKKAATDNPKPVTDADTTGAAQAKAIGTALATTQSGSVNKPRGRKPPPTVVQPKASATDDEDLSDLFIEDRHPFILAGPNAVQFGMKMLERKTIAHEAMKPKGKSILENGNLAASQGLDLAQEMANDAERERTGGQEIEDVSRYLVTLHRYFAKDAPDWTGEVIGPPEFIPLTTVDIVAAGQTLYVFNKNNKKLWEAKLAYPAGRHFESGHPPTLETNGTLYFADLGVLTCFELATGAVRWRMNSVGISHVQTDDRGRIYVSTTDAGQDHIRYSLQVNIHEKIKPVLLEVDPQKGKVLWRQESIGDDCMVSGKFLYSTRMSSTISALRLEEGPDSHYTLSLLSHSDGAPIWNFRRTNRTLLKTEVQKNWILLQFADEVLVMKFFSL